MRQFKGLIFFQKKSMCLETEKFFLPFVSELFALFLPHEKADLTSNYRSLILKNTKIDLILSQVCVHELQSKVGLVFLCGSFCWWARFGDDIVN